MRRTPPASGARHDTMSADLVRRLVEEACNQGNLAALDAVLPTPGPADPAAPIGSAAAPLRDYLAAFRAAVPDARAGGTLSVAITEPTSIDPALVPSADNAGQLVVRTMCDTLFGTNPASGDLSPDLADKVIVGGNGTIITILLRRGVRFANGARLTSADVVASLTRVARPETASVFMCFE